MQNKYELATEPKSVQIGVRFEAPQKYFQRLIDSSHTILNYIKSLITLVYVHFVLTITRLT
jgi:uncharacterized FAD-dependent dehydrogenase